MIVERAGGYFEMNRPFLNFVKALPQSESWCSSFHILVIISHMYTKLCGLALSYAKEKAVCSMVVKSSMCFSEPLQAQVSTILHCPLPPLPVKTLLILSILLSKSLKSLIQVPFSNVECRLTATLLQFDRPKLENIEGQHNFRLWPQQFGQSTACVFIIF